MGQRRESRGSGRRERPSSARRDRAPSSARRRAPSRAGASSSRQPRPPDQKPIGLYVAVGGLSVAAIAGLILAFGGGTPEETAPRARAPQIARGATPEKAQPGTSETREPAPRRLERRQSPPPPKQPREADDGRADLLRKLEAARRRIDDALARDDLVQARSVLQEFSLELMEVAADDPLRQDVAQLQARIDARAAALAGPSRNKPGPGRGAVDWEHEVEIFLRHINSRNYKAVEAHAPGIGSGSSSRPRSGRPRTWCSITRT